MAFPSRPVIETTPRRTETGRARKPILPKAGLTSRNGPRNETLNGIKMRIVFRPDGPGMAHGLREAEMKTLLPYAAIVLLALVCGCRANVSHELLERELLAQENQIYQLQDLVDEYESRLESCHRENESLLAELGRSRTSGKRGAAPRNGDKTEEMLPPVIEQGSEGSAMPLISPPDPKVPEGEHMAKKGKSAKGGLLGGAKVRSTSTARGPIDLVVTQITLNRKLTGGHNVDGHPGDEGVMVVVEPLNAAGDLVEVPGEISIVLLDPTIEGEAARIARWDFSSKDAAGYLKRTAMGDGLHFDLRWPHSAPVHRVLNLYVRYTTADGRRLQVEKQIEVDPPGGADTPKERFTETAPTEATAADDTTASPDRPKTIRSVRDDAGRPNSSTGLRGPGWAPYR